MFKNKESSEKVECSTQTDESTDPRQNINKDVLSQSEADGNDITIKIEFKAKCKKIDCKYINESKGCRRGKQCWYSHENDIQECAFWLQGSCRFSNKKCWNKHNTSIKRIKTEPKLIIETEKDVDVDEEPEYDKPEVEELMKVITGAF